MAAAHHHRSVVEIERDAAIEEAAQAIFLLHHVQKELQDARSSSMHPIEFGNQHNPAMNPPRDDGGDKGGACTWDPKRVAEMKQTKQRSDQILWHIGHLAEVIWDCCAGATGRTQRDRSKKDQRTTSTPMFRTASDLKCAVLEEFQKMAPKEEAYLYDEMHGLYKQVARHEKLQANMEEQILSLAHENEELRAQLRALSYQVDDRVTTAQRANPPTLKYEQLPNTDFAPAAAYRAQQETAEAMLRECTKEIQDLRESLDEKENQVKQLLEMVESQAAVIHSSALHAVEVPAGHGTLQYAKAHVLRKKLKDVQPFALGDGDDAAGPMRAIEQEADPTGSEDYDGFEAPMDFQSAALDQLGPGDRIAPHPGKNLEASATTEQGETVQPSCGDDEADSTEILQAQLEMYVRYFQRKKGKPV